MMAAILLLLLSALSLDATAFQTSVPRTSFKARKDVVNWKYARDNAEDSTTHKLVASTEDVNRAAAITELTAQNVVISCMDAMMQNDVPWLNHGLEICFDFSSDRCRAALGGSLDDFISYASNPTFGSLVNAKTYDIVNVGPIIAGTATRGSMQTVLVKITQHKFEDKHFLW
jgi:hypothetical protein